ncbi:MAG: hypothetical protein ACKOMX_02030, partial [Actinomycetota bacterium]
WLMTSNTDGRGAPGARDDRLVHLAVDGARAQVPTCRQFHASGAAVRFPADTAEATYGLWDGTALLTRSGTIPIAGDGWEQLASVTGLYLMASVKEGLAVDPTPALLVRPSAVLDPLVGRQARVMVRWLAPPEGATDARAILRFPTRSTAEIATYRQGLRVGATCVAALAKTPAARQLYAPFFADGTLALLWYPAMHTALDSEIVIDSPNGPSWMTRGPELIDLLRDPWKPTRVAFSIHANPMGTPAQIKGPLSAEKDGGRCSS